LACCDIGAGLVKAFAEVNTQLGTAARKVKRFAILPTGLSVEDGTLMPDGKVDRRGVKHRHPALIKNLLQQ